MFLQPNSDQIKEDFDKEIGQIGQDSRKITHLGGITEKSRLKDLGKGSIGWSGTSCARSCSSTAFCRLSFSPTRNDSAFLMSFWLFSFCCGWKYLNQMRDKDFFRLMNIPLKDNNSSNLNAVLILNNCIITWREENCKNTGTVGFEYETHTHIH